jgi:hypothetical protein
MSAAERPDADARVQVSDSRFRIPDSRGLLNRRFGWMLFLVGILYGMTLGLFAFDGPLASPDRFADYASVPRRLVRLAHIACMALGIVNVVYGHELDRARLDVGKARLGSRAMIAAGVLMPSVLTLAAFESAWKWLLPVPSLAALVAVALVVSGLVGGGQGRVRET